ncbi:C1 family peptidase [Variovorax sp. PBL-E5]|uniref:C1 family peptidase n=1 Tax=Variovorax sp. PBL-E5 TaxID=434014 RepID=UPI0013171199|nr:C1 family peptidase [Variovorax sp. PBL-E5]VTU36295.1 Papain family cysteine protease [Variovorax sp. PBL-E5]
MHQHSYGWKPSLPDFRDHRFKVTARIALPPSVDLRPGCPPVYDQGQLGSCTANAAAAAFEFDLKRQGLTDFEPSRLFIYYNERVLDGDVGQDAGSELRTAAKTLNKSGVCDEKSWPYDIAKFKTKPKASCYTAAKKHVSTSYQALDNTNVTELRTCLASGSPFILGFTVYESFESDKVATTGVVPMPLKKEKVLGGHAVMCVGYQESKKRFIVRNSWGVNWGVQGYCYFPYAYLTNTGLATDFWQITTVS